MHSCIVLEGNAATFQHTWLFPMQDRSYFITYQFRIILIVTVLCNG